jgi:hypothetical protein
MKKLDKFIICYVNVGASESFRADVTKDKADWDIIKKGKMEGWDEYWLDISNTEVIHRVMTKRFQ